MNFLQMNKKYMEKRSVILVTFFEFKTNAAPHYKKIKMSFCNNSSQESKGKRNMNKGMLELTASFPSFPPCQDA